jgi:hypothetical protein
MFLPDSNIMSFLAPFINMFNMQQHAANEENNIIKCGEIFGTHGIGASTSGRMSTILHEVVKYSNNNTLCIPMLVIQ